MQLVMPDPAEKPFVHSLDEVVTMLRGVFAERDVPLDVHYNRIQPGVRAIVLGADRLPADVLRALPADSVIYNMEPLGSAGNRKVSPETIELMGDCVIWDYSRKNLDVWRAQCVHTCMYVPPGYTSALESPALRAAVRQTKDIDVLFYGLVNERRKAILQELKRRKFNVVAATGIFGAERDALIARARVVVNVHFYEASIIELVRLSYLWANRVPVVTELNSTTESDAEIRTFALHAPYTGLVDKVESLLASDLAEIDALTAQSYEGFRSECNFNTRVAAALGWDVPRP